MQKLLFSLTLLQLFSLSANSPFDNASNPFEAMHYVDTLPMTVIHKLNIPNPDLAYVFTNQKSQVLFVFPVDITYEEYIALYKTFNEITNKPSSSEENNTNEKTLEKISRDTEEAAKDEE